MSEVTKPCADHGGGATGAASGAAPELPRMGGIALKNGLVLLTERYWAAAVREAYGSVSVASGKKPRLPGSGDAGDREAGGSAAGREVRGGGVPLLRGLSRFGESLLVLAQVKLKLPQAQLPLEGGRVAAALAGSVAATSAVRTFAPRSPLVQEAGAALAAFVPAVLSLKNSAISGYHGAEHKVIGSREAAARAEAAAWSGPRRRAVGAPAARVGARMAPAEAGAAAAAKEHDRCGSNLVGPYLLATVATNLLARGRLGRKSPAASAVAGAVSLGVALEALRWANAHGDSMVARLLLLPGRALQRRLTTTEPTPEQLEVGERAMAELLRLERAGI